MRISFHHIRIRAHLGFDMLGGCRWDKGKAKCSRRSSLFCWLLDNREIGKKSLGVNTGILEFMMVKVCDLYDSGRCLGI